MTSFKSYESYEAMLTDMEIARRRADARVEPYQAALKGGDFALSVQNDLLVAYEVLDPKEFASKDPDEDMKSWAEVYDEPHMKNFRYTRAYSEIVPEGELGDVHVSVCVPISKDVFELLKESVWQMTPEIRDRLLRITEELVG